MKLYPIDIPQGQKTTRRGSKNMADLLDDNGVATKLPDLQKWSVHSHLGNIVQQITNIFNTSAPTIEQRFCGSFQKPSGPQSHDSHPQPSWVCNILFLFV